MVQEEQDHAMAKRMAQERDHQQQHSSSSSSQPKTTQYMVTVPDNVYTGMPFEIKVNGQTFRVTCPTNALPGHRIQIALPNTNTDTNTNTNTSSSTSGSHTSSHTSSSGASEQYISGEILFLPTQEREEHGGSSMHYVTVPKGVYTGMRFQVKINGKKMRVTCPLDALPGQRIHITLPSSSTNTSSGSHANSHNSSGPILGENLDFGLDFGTSGSHIRSHYSSGYFNSPKSKGSRNDGGGRIRGGGGGRKRTGREGYCEFFESTHGAVYDVTRGDGCYEVDSGGHGGGDCGGAFDYFGVGGDCSGDCSGGGGGGDGGGGDSGG